MSPSLLRRPRPAPAAGLAAGCRLVALLALAAATAGPAPAVAAAGPASTAPEWRREGGGWSVKAAAGERAELAQALAAASGTALRGDLRLLSAAPPLTLWLHAVALEEAWRVVLGPASSYALQCAGVGRCRLWLLGVRSPAPAAHAPAAGGPGSAAAWPAVPPAEARAAADLRTPDPPGLFPSD